MWCKNAKEGWQFRAFTYGQCMQAGIEMGIKPQDAAEMVAQSCKGAAELILKNHSHPSIEIDKGWRKKAIATLRPYQPKTMMDVATRTGDFALLAAKELKPHQLIGTDISEGMIAIGKEKIQKAGMH